MSGKSFCAIPAIAILFVSCSATLRVTGARTFGRTQDVTAADIQTAVAAFQASMAHGPARYGDIEVINHNEIHSALIVLFMFTLWKRWFLTDIPFDSFYAPFFFTSGPLVYYVAHFLQLWSERFFPADASVFLSWDVVPGVVCLILGGIQWWCIGRLWLWFRTRRLSHASPHGTQEV